MQRSLFGYAVPILFLVFAGCKVDTNPNEYGQPPSTSPSRTANVLAGHVVLVHAPASIVDSVTSLVTGLGGTVRPRLDLRDLTASLPLLLLDVREIHLAVARTHVLTVRLTELGTGEVLRGVTARLEGPSAPFGAVRTAVEELVGDPLNARSGI